MRSTGFGAKTSKAETWFYDYLAEECQSPCLQNRDSNPHGQRLWRGRREVLVQKCVVSWHVCRDGRR